jgi:uncharacterized protein RhaS with RHS repeats
LYHVGARAYNPRTARWLQRDPIDASSGDPNLYRYAGNDPVNRADPSGLTPGWVHGGLDLAGWIPGIGEAADLINAGLYALEGDWGNAGISALGTIPGLGDAAKAERIGKRAKDLAEEWLPSNALYNRGVQKRRAYFVPLATAKTYCTRWDRTISLGKKRETLAWRRIMCPKRILPSRSFLGIITEQPLLS